MVYFLPVTWLPNWEGIKLIWQNIAFILAVFTVYGLLERQRGWKLGLSQTPRLRQFAKGTAFGILLMSLITFLLFAVGGVEFKEVNLTPQVMVGLLQSLALFLLVGLSEEILSRGYIQGLLRHTFNRRVAWIGSSLLFALLHSFNPGMWSDGLPIINLFLAGLFFSIYRDASGSLWAPAGFHFAWNFWQGPISGFKVSGLALPSIVESQPLQASFLSGGDFGAEGSAVCTVVLLIAIFWLNRRAVATA